MNHRDQNAPTQPASLGGAIGWSGLAQGWNLLLTIGSALILARLLTPSDYAVMAVILPVVGIAQMLQSLGFGQAIQQARDLTQRQLDALFWLTLAVAIGLCLAIVLTAPLIATAFGNPKVGPALSVATLSILLAGLAAQPNALLARRLQFRTIALRDLIASTIGAGATVLLALVWRSHWALLAGIILIPSTNLVLSAIAAHWRPGPPIRPGEAGALLGFGFRIWGGNLFDFAARNADNLIVARFSTPQDLGIYDRSYRVLFNPLNQAAMPLGKVLVPSLAQLRDDPPRYREAYWRAVALLLLACHPGLALALAYPVTMIGALLGPAWLAGAPLFRWFALGGLFSIYLGTIAWLFVSQGRAAEYLRLSMITASVALVSFLVGIRWGVEGVAMGLVFGQVFIAFPLALFLASRRGPIALRDFLDGLFPHAVATASVALLVFAERALFGLPRWPELIPTAIAAYLIYGGVLLAMPSSRGTMKAILHGARRLLTRVRV